MWFRCSGGNGTGDGATITVTYSSQFYNKTMTCSKGSKTYTKITTSSGSTVFDVDESGTWTITCDGTSRTVDVVLEYSTQMAITKTITVYSAASDTVSFTDVTGAKTVTTDTSGRGSVSITFLPPSATITFTSSKAKNPNNLSANYSKSISITNSTTAIYVMPDNALFWWGYMGSNAEYFSAENGWTYSAGFANPTINQSGYADCNSQSNSGKYVGIVSKNKVTCSKINGIVTGVISNYSRYGSIMAYTSKNLNSEPDTILNDAITNTTMGKVTGTITSQTCYIGIQAVLNRRIYLYAMWYE